MNSFFNKIFGRKIAPVVPPPPPAVNHLTDFVGSFLEDDGTIKESVPVVDAIFFDKQWIPERRAYFLENDTLSKYYARHKVSKIFIPDPEREGDMIGISLSGKVINFEICQGLSCTVGMGDDKSFHVIISKKGTGKYQYCGKYSLFSAGRVWDNRLLTKITVVTVPENSYGTDFGMDPEVPTPFCFNLPNGDAIEVDSKVGEFGETARLELTSLYMLYEDPRGYVTRIFFSMLRGKDGENYCLFFDEDEGQWYVFNDLSVVEAWCLITR